MSNAIAPKHIAIPCFADTISGKEKIYTRNLRNKETNPLVASVDKTGGATTIIGAVGKSLAYFAAAAPDSSMAGTAARGAHVATNITSGLAFVRAGVAFDKLLVTLRPLTSDNIKETVNMGDLAKNTLDVTHNSLSAASLIVTDGAVVTAFKGVSGTLKTVSDGIELWNTAGKLNVLSQQRAAVTAKEIVKDKIEVSVKATEKIDGHTVAKSADKVVVSDKEILNPVLDPTKVENPKKLVEPEMKEGLDNEFTVALLKVVRLALGLFPLVLSALAFVFKVAIAKELLVAGAIAALGSAIFAVAAELVSVSVDIQPVSKEYLPYVRSGAITA